MPKLIGSEWLDSSEEQGTGLAGTTNRFTIRYTVLGETTQHTRDEILSTAGIPVGYEGLAGGRARRRKVDFKDALARLYYVDVEFDSRLDDLPQVEKTLAPELRRPSWSWSSERIEEVLEVDAEDASKKVETKAGDKLLIKRPRRIPVLRVSRYAPVFDPDVYQNFLDHVNSEPVWGAPPGCALLDDVQDEETFVEWQGARLRYRWVTSILKFNFKRDKDGELIGWDAYVLHQGEHYLVPTEGAVRPPARFKDADRKPRIGLLDPDGYELAEGAEPNYLRFKRFPKKDLNALNLGPFV